MKRIAYRLIWLFQALAVEMACISVSAQSVDTKDWWGIYKSRSKAKKSVTTGVMSARVETQKQKSSTQNASLVTHRSYYNPYYSYKDCLSIFLNCIICTSESTIVYGRYNNIESEWACISSGTVLRDTNTGRTYKLLRAEGLPMSPSKHYFSSKYQELQFTLYFEPISSVSTCIDMIEDSKDENAFNFYEIDLTGKRLPIDSEYAKLPKYTPASFPGGESVCMAYLQEHIFYPSTAQQQGIQGRVIVSFVVERDGSLSNIKVIKSPSPILSQAAILVVDAMPKWIPARMGNRTVRSTFNLPIMFRLN